MTTTKDISAKFAVAAVAVAMIFSAYATPAAAQTDLQAQITALLAQIQMLEAQLTGEADVTAPAGAPALCPYTWTRDLTMGSEGADVMKLQQFLNSYPDLRVAATGAGSAGMETMFFGPATAAAVSKMQVMFRAEVLTPNGLVNPTGYFGPSSRSKANDLCIADATTEEVEEGEATEEEEEETGPMTLRGEGVLATLELDDEEDEVQEGAEDIVVATLTLEAEDGDIELSRVTMTLDDANNGTDNEESDPWDVFEEVSLWIDGDKVASFEADDEDNYLDEDSGEFRFSGLDLFLGEDEEVEILVAVSVVNSVDGAGQPSATTADWDISPTSVRYFDADGVATTETVADSFGDLGNDVEFDIVEEGFDDEAEIESSSNDPESTTLKVDIGNDESDEFVTHVFEIEVGEDSSDLIVDDVWYAVTVTSAADITDGQQDVIAEITMTIDGMTVEGDAVRTGELNVGPDLEGAIINAAGGGTTTVHYVFEFDEDLVLEADETYEVEVSMVFEGQDGNYANGVLVQGTAPGTIWQVEGLDSNNVLTGADSSQEHTLANSVPIISGVSDEVTADDPNNSGTISWEFNVEADDEDVTFAVANNAVVNGSTDDVEFTVTGTDTGIATATLTLIDGDADFAAGVWTINDGDDATFALDVTFTTVDAGDNGTYRVNLDRIGGVEVDENSGGLSLSN